MALIHRPIALTLRALGLGDFLTGIPALRALRRAFPDHEHVLAAPAVLSPLVELAGVADRVHPASGLGSLNWLEEAPSVAVNLHGRGPQSSMLLRATAPSRLVAFANPEAGVAGPRWVADEYEVRRWCRLVSEELGVAADATDLDLKVPPQDSPVAGAVVVHPGAAFGSRRWPPDRFAAVAREVAADGLPVVVTGSAGDSALAGEVATAAGLPPTALLAGKTTLLELAALVSSARLVICGDTGVAHLATAYGRPSVVLFGPVSPHLWGPPTTGPHVVIWHGDGRGDPWGAATDPALLATSVEEVVTAARRLLGDTSSAGRLPGGVPLERPHQAVL